MNNHTRKTMYLLFHRIIDNKVENTKYFEENHYEVVAKTIETNSLSLKKLTQDFFPKYNNINLDFFENPNDKLVFNDFSLKSLSPEKFFLDSKFSFDGIHLILGSDSIQFKNLNGNGICDKKFCGSDNTSKLTWF